MGNHGTPASKDKRLWLSAAVVFAVMGIKVAYGLEFSDQYLGFFTLMTSVYVGQSQWGLVKRAPKPPAAPVEPPK